MNGLLTCPFCGYSRNTGPAGIPPWAETATCPKCARRFPLRPGGSEKTTAADVSGDRSEAPSPARETPDCRRGGGSPQSPLRRSALDLLRAPHRFFSTRSIEGTEAAGGLFSFGLLFGSLGTMLAVFWQFAALAWRLAPESSGIVLLGLGAAFTFCIAMVPLWVTAAMVVNTAVVHACLRIVGAGRQGLGATFRVVAYSQAAKALGIFPVVGGPAAIVWQLTIQVIGLREAHEISSLRLLLAAAVPAVLISLVAVAAALI